NASGSPKSARSTPPAWSRVVPASTTTPRSPCTRSRLHAGDELVDPIVVGAERVLAEDGALGLVVELEVDPVDGVVAAAFLGLADELAAEAGPGGLGGLLGGAVDGPVVAHPLDRAVAVPQVVDAPPAVDHVVGQRHTG